MTTENMLINWSLDWAESQQVPAMATPVARALNVLIAASAQPKLLTYARAKSAAASSPEKLSENGFCNMFRDWSAGRKVSETREITRMNRLMQTLNLPEEEMPLKIYLELCFEKQIRPEQFEHTSVLAEWAKAMKNSGNIDLVEQLNDLAAQHQEVSNTHKAKTLREAMQVKYRVMQTYNDLESRENQTDEEQNNYKSVIQYLPGITREDLNRYLLSS